MAVVVDEPRLREKLYVFEDRFHAGEVLAQKLREYEKKENTLILAIPAGGVQVASVVAHKLSLPFDVAVTRKLHIPWNPEAGFGAVSWDGSVLLNERIVAALGLTEDEIQRCIAEEKHVIARRLKLFRGDAPFPSLSDKTVIVVDDGLASGFSMIVTAKSLEKAGASHKIVAVPTAPANAIELLRPLVEKIVCLNTRSGPIFAVADAYRSWYDLNDDDVLKELRKIPGMTRTEN